MSSKPRTECKTTSIYILIKLRLALNCKRIHYLCMNSQNRPSQILCEKDDFLRKTRAFFILLIIFMFANIIFICRYMQHYKSTAETAKWTIKEKKVSYLK